MVLASIFGSLLAACTERVIFHDEPTVLTITAAFLHGQPVYPSKTDPVEYGLLYGPSLYLVYLPPMIAGADRVSEYQLWVTVALVSSYIFLFLGLRRWGIVTALGGLALVAVSVCILSDVMWATKGDIWILFFSALGLWASFLQHKWQSVVLVAISGAALVDLKVTLIFIALLPAVLLWQRGRKTHLPALLSVALIPSLALLPFVLPHISITGYSQQLQDAAHQGFSWFTLQDNLFFVFQISLPTLALLWMISRKNASQTRTWMERRRAFLLLLSAAVVTAILTGAKNGGGAMALHRLHLPFDTCECRNVGDCFPTRQ
jgi:hypothetical protein